ncbi:MAG: hypothetical protein HYX78_02145 [Armatimonadetes bacterium]|nr:hypothetical protein [Armatimonadota bacterium]
MEFAEDTEGRTPVAVFAFLRILLGAMWIYEAARGVPWAVPAAAAGILLLIGALTPLAAILGAVTALVVLQRAGPVEAWGNWVWLHWLVILMHLLVAGTRAGRVAGVDAWLAARRSRWPIQ